MIAATTLDPLERTDDALYEVVEGVIVEKPVSAMSIAIASDLIQLMGPAARSRRLGRCFTEMVFILDEVADLRRRPDMAFVAANRWPIDRQVPWQGDWPIAPNLAVEVASPTNLFVDLVGKADEYFRHGVDEVWIIVPDERLVYVYLSPNEAKILHVGGTLSTPQIPGWSLPVADLLPEPPKAAETNGAP